VTHDRIRFSKYHGLGNDFVIVDLREVDGELRERMQDPAVVRATCDRRFGVGGDGVLAILAPRDRASADARMRVLNADGSEAEMCGNGLRCVVKHLHERDETLRDHTITPDRITIDTDAGPLPCAITARDGVVHTVTVDMGRPRLARRDIPMAVAPDQSGDEPFISGVIDLEGRLPGAVAAEFQGRTFTGTAVSMGNPHIILFVPESGAELRTLAEKIGPAIETHPLFPERTNVEFAHRRSDREFELVVWERGCGITLACGTGACATAAAACLTEQTRPDQELTVHLLGGDLSITVAPEYQTAFMRGPATHVFDAELRFDGLRPE